MSYIICPNCKYHTLSGYVYCKQCGSSLPGITIPAELLSELVIIYPDGKSRTDTSFALPSTTITIGRTEDNAIVLLSDEEVSRHHAAISRDPDGRYCVEDLRSTNGTFLNGTRINSPMLVSIGDELWIGKTVLQFESPSKTALKNAGQPLSTDPAGINQEKSPTERTYHAVDTGQTHNASFCPDAREGWTLRNLDEENGNYALINHNSSVYKKLNKRSAHMWKLMDGQHSLYDILVDYLNTFHSPGADRLIDLVDELAEKGFLQNVEPQSQPSLSAGSESSKDEADEKAPTEVIQKRFLIQGIDDWLTKIYTAFAWRLFTRTGKFILAAIALSGFVAFLFIMFQNDYSLFRVRDSYIGGIIVIGLSHLITIFTLKLGQALVVKSHHRHVRQAGFMMDHGLPTFFVDSSDIWLEPKGPRIHATMAGPYTSFLIGSIVSLVITACPNTLINSILFILAAWSNIITFFHLNPMLNLDGYFSLMDVMEIPQLRKRSIEFMRKDLWKKLWKRESFSKEEINYALFSILSFLWILIAARVIFIYIRPLWRKMMTPGFELFKS